jgi:hypothetical protein
MAEKAKPFFLLEPEKCTMLALILGPKIIEENLEKHTLKRFGGTLRCHSFDLFLH